MNKKKALVVVLAATMTMGSSMAAFAAEGSGNTTGIGENEGHVDKEVINVVLPTVDAGSSPFSYITDPERLIQGTAGAKYEDFTFPDKGSDTGVYFKVGDNEYANTSQTLKVINKSSTDVKVTVKVTAQEGGSGTDLALAPNGDAGLTKDAPLFLNLKVGQTDTPVTSSEQTVEKVIGGKEENYEVAYADGEYKYVPKADANKWNALEISVNGAAFETAVQETTTAPKLAVTWEYEKDTSGIVSTTDQVEYVDGPSVSVSSTGLVTVTGLTKTANYNNKITFAGDGITQNQSDKSLEWNIENWSAANGGTFTVQMPAGWVSYWSGKEVTVTVSLTDGSNISAKATIS